ncbi:hypothetical protein B4U37_19970 [Sutcliffiella horikoshii]|uniref:Uncharacterized protein n=1 Tax=Sutcliffiella horikoshii TaxID=79883 RepID=A0ABN4ZMN9_9BACI|nr:hypothetical protein [Sutcliffiella horikoshii]ART78178.1 hypothetical protein B4U37_19970 [Sutcliffiella horikoshii]
MDKVQSLQEINLLLSKAERIQQLEAFKPRVSLKGVTDNERSLSEQYYKRFPDSGRKREISENQFGLIVLTYIGLLVLLCVITKDIEIIIISILAGGIGIFIIIWPIISIINNYIFKYNKKNDAEYERRRFEYINEQKQKYKELHSEEWNKIQKNFNENQGKLIIQIRREMQQRGFINHSYHQVETLRTLKIYLETGRADSLKEALNLYHLERNHHQQQQYMHDTMQEMEDRYTEQMEDVEWQFQNANEAFERKVSGMEDEIVRLKRRER